MGEQEDHLVWLDMKMEGTVDQLLEVIVLTGIIDVLGTKMQPPSLLLRDLW